MEDEDVLKFKAVITFCRYYNSDTTWGVYGFYTDDDIPQYTKETILFRNVSGGTK